MKLSLVFTTYNSPLWLEKVLWSVLEQQYRNFEIIIADDGSTDETRHVIDALKNEFVQNNITMTHIWQRDEGFRKCRILNKAILAAKNDYIVFTDGDCILRNDFLAEHANNAQTGYYLSGTYFKLPLSISRKITRDDIVSQRCFQRQWLHSIGLPKGKGRLKLTNNPNLARFANRCTPTACNFKGANASAWKSDILAVGGLDERLHWGGEDREFGVRLQNSGIKPRHVRFNAVCLHLYHERSYKNDERVKSNREHRLQVERNRVKRTTFGTDRLQ